MQADAADEASRAQGQASQAAIDEQRRQFDQTRADVMPFRDTGVAANARLRQLLGLDSGYGGEDSGSLLKRFGASDLNADPVYQNGLDFGLQEGTKGINARAMSSGMYDSGATLKALTRFGNDYGTTKAEGAYNRFNNDQGNVFNRLSGISGTGQTATNTISSAGQNSSNNISNLMTGQGNASAAGIVGGANAWGGALGNIGNQITGNAMLDRILKQRGGNSSGTYSYNNDNGSFTDGWT